MATQQYGYGPNVWASAKGTGAVDMPTLSQPGGAAPQFKKQNPLATSAAKMVGEIAYGAMQQNAAPKYAGIDEKTQRPVFEWQPNSDQYEPEGGWTLPQGGIDSRNLPIIHKELDIANVKNESMFENNRLMSDIELAAADPDGIGLASRGIDMAGFEPTIVPDETNTETNTNTETKTYNYPDDWNPLTSSKGPDFLGVNKDGVEGIWKYQDPVYPQGGYGEVKEGYWYHKPITSFSGYQDGSTVTIDGKTYTMIGS